MDSDADPGRPVRDFIGDWPYTPQYLQATLDPELISEHGRAILRRCLTNGRVVCFVGSGVSMAYGRVGWGTLVRQLTRLDGSADLQRASGIRKHLLELLRDLNLEGRSPFDEVQSGRYPAAFQFKERLDQLGDPHNRELRERAMRLLYDDRGHAALLFEGLRRDLDKLEPATRGPDGEAKKWAEDQVGLPGTAALHRRGAAQRGSNDAGVDHWRDLLIADEQLFDDLRVSLSGAAPATQMARDLLDAIQPALKCCEAMPLRRFVVPALYRLIKREDFNSSHEKRKQSASQQRRGLLRSRLIPEPSDPLLLLSRDLQVSRFITTNYDLDLERLLHDRGFKIEERKAIRPARERGDTDRRHTISVNALGARARDTLFRRDHAVELIDLAVQSAGHAYQVVHLHGRATQGDEMVITERDYLDQYLQRGEEAEIVNDAIALAFGANPVLFVGSGMSEDDILRPLRQFVAERKSRVDRSAIVLLPAAGSRARQIEEVIALYSRYGVYTVHYGIGQDPALGANNAGDSEPVRWLAHFLFVIKSLKTVLRKLDTALAEKWALPKLRGELKRDLGSFVDGAALGERRAFDTWTRLLEPPNGRWPVLQLPAQLELEASSPRVELGLEVTLLNSSLHFVCDVIYQVTNIDPAQQVIGPDYGCRDEFLQRRAAMTLPEEPTGDGGAMHRLVLTHLALLEGLPDAFIGLSLCAKLSGLRDDWRRWLRGRQLLPTVRSPAEERLVLPFDVANRDGNLVPGGRMHPPVPVIARHAIALRRPPGAPSRAGYPVPATDRFFSEAPSQTIRTLYRALTKERGNPKSALCRPCNEAGRRVFLFIAPRGVGKGHFFEAMRTRRRLGEFVRLSWPTGQNVSNDKDFCTYAGFAFFNLSFSLEVVSVVDRLTELLVERATHVFPWIATVPGGLVPVVEAINEAARTLHDNRIGRLAAVLRLYAKHAEHAHSRILVAINGFNLLFDERGDPKNAELHRVIRAMLAEANDTCPLDFLLICSETGFPKIFLRGPARTKPLKNAHLDAWSGRPPIAFEHLIRSDISEKGQRRLDMLVQRLGVNIPKAVRDPRGAPPRRGCNFVHVLREARTSNTVAKYFPAVALSLACHPGYLRDGAPGNNKVMEIEFCDLAVLDAIQLAIIEGSHSLDSAEPMIARIPTALRRLGDRIAARVVRGGDPALFGTTEDLEAVRDSFQVGPGGSATTADARDDHGRAVDRDFTYIFRVFGGNRFLVTLACAAVSELAWAPQESQSNGARPTGPARKPRLRTLYVAEWFANLGAQLSTSPPQARDDAIIARVFEVYQGRHESGNGVPPAFEHAQVSALRGPAGWALQLRLLWHLAIVGHPVEADVLALAPTVRHECLPMFDHDSVVSKGSPAERERVLALVRGALDVLVHRCLVFRIAPPFGDVADATTAADADQCASEFLSERSGWRFAVHGFIQRAIFRQLHAPFVEFPHVDQFGLSMWATQPDDLPRLNRSAARSIAELIADWTGAPADLERITSVSVYHQALAQSMAPAPAAEAPHAAFQRRTLPARLLRAAYGVVRSTYSVGVVSRFHDFEGGLSEDAPEEGYFEQHRLQIRWLLERAVELARHDPLPPAAPFHAEEIVWLYNECGLFCLVEGRLDPAAGLFHDALRAAGRIEGLAERGALWCRINLNLAIVDIERGRIRDARRNLLEIRAVEDENPILRILAQGFLGLVEHLSGHLDVAQKIYRDVIEDLHIFGQSRSIAIFSRHLADLHRVRRPSEPDDAMRAIERAIASATKGGHEDVRQFALLSRVRILISDPEPARAVDIQSSLDAIERYGVEMGMPRLIADTAYARAEHLLQLGETRRAAQLARQCLEVATANNLRLRQMTALALLAKIYQRRGMLTAAEPLLARAAELADLCDYSNAHEGGARRGAFAS